MDYFYRRIRRQASLIVAILPLLSSMTVLANSDSIPYSYSFAVKAAAPAVVNIYTVREIKQSYPSRYPLVRRTTLGSGVIIDRKGDLLTNYHVVQKATRILVALSDGRSTKAKLVGYDRETDLAVLHINLKNLEVISLGNSDHVQVGDVVLAIGNPFGLGQTVTQGIVSAMGRNAVGINQLENYIQTDAAINPGNSGGALINAKGEVIGINTGIYSHSGGYQGVGFAIPINVVLNVMNQIIKTGMVQRGWIGIRVRTVKLPSTSGVVVTRITPYSPASQSGIAAGDIIISVNRQRIRTAHGFLNYIAQRKPHSTVKVVFLRHHRTHRIVVTVGVRPKGMIDDRERVSL